MTQISNIPKVYRIERCHFERLEDRLNEINMSRDFSIISVQHMSELVFAIVVIDLREMYGKPERDDDEVAN